ncbi:MAG: Wzz/FepE/Etk N-terminal domain-containing protein [bacterium]|nr:Wzz/FepE/Etk N-terminal domain-containing protein [bacterium]
MGNLQDDEMEIDLLEIFYELKKRIWIILAALVLGSGVAGVFSKVVLTPQYSSTAMMYILSKETTLTSLADLQIGSQLTKDYKVIVTSRPVLEKVMENLGMEGGYRSLKTRVTIDNPTDTRILNISVEDPDPQMAKAIVDEVATVSSAYIAEIMEMTPPKIIENGEIATVKSSPNVKKNVALGGLAAVFVVCGIIVLRVIMNDTIRTEEDVEKYLGLTVLAAVPLREEAGNQKKKPLSKTGKSGIKKR